MPEVRKHVLVALVLNTIVFILVLGALLWLSFSMTGDLVEGSWWEMIIGYLLRALAVVTSVVAAPIIFKLLATLVLPAFNSAVFDAARKHAGGPEIPEEAVGLPVAEVIRIEVSRVGRFIGLLAAIFLGTLILSPIPLLNLITTPIGISLQFLLGAATLGWDLHSFHFELHGLGYKDQKAYLKAKRGRRFGMGAVATILVMIPVIQLLFLTTNVAGAGLVSAWLDGAPRPTT